MEEYRNSKSRNERLVSARRGEDASYANLSADARDARLLAELTDLVLNRHQGDADAAFHLATRAGVSPEDMADYYIPAVARDLGAQWCTDELGFAEVTIGSARLQAMLRELGESWTADHGMNPDASTVLLVVADGVHHTLGAFVLSGQLRRKGLSVRLLLGATPQNINESFELTQFDAVFISSNIGDNLESLRKIVDSIRTSRGNPPPVVIGGTLLETNADVVALTGTDYIAKTVDEAIALCNLRTKPRINAAMDQ